MKKAIENKIREMANVEMSAPIKYRHILKFQVNFAEGEFEYEMDARFIEIEMKRFANDLKDCTNNMNSVRVSNFIFDYAL